MRGLFVTGTDTGVGKTHVVCLMARQLQRAGHAVGLYKPACSGAEMNPAGQPVWDDVERLHAALDGRFDRQQICPQRFEAPLAPPMAATREGRTVDLAQIDAGLTAWATQAPQVIVEGAGGWLCPMTPTSTFADWVARWQMPVLIVARRGLGTINHTLLTIEAIQRRHLAVVGVVLNQSQTGDDDPSVAENAHEITLRSGIPVLGQIPWGETRELLHDGHTVTVHWASLMNEISSPAGSIA
ncbi:dethiobiotin synthase [bacterium]|nr:dethiobiotin synthase [bacterium]